MASMLIGLPCTIGMMVFADQILNLLYPAQPEGALILPNIITYYNIYNIRSNNQWYFARYRKVMTPATSLFFGLLAKLIVNLALVSNPTFGANGAAIGSVVCHMVAFSIAFTTLRKNIKLELKIGTF